MSGEREGKYLNIPMALARIKSEIRGQNIEERLASSDPCERVQAIFDHVDIRTDACSFTGSLEVDPREEFREAIEIAKGSGNAALLEKTYTHIIDHHERGRYFYEAALIAHEAERADKAWTMIMRMINLDGNPDLEGAREIASMLGISFEQRLKSETEARITAKQSEFNKLFPEPYSISQKIYVSTRGSTYSINDSGILFRNGKPFAQKPTFTIFVFRGIITQDAYQDVMGNIMVSSRYNTWRETEALYHFIKHYDDEQHNYVQVIAWEEVENHINRGVGLVGVNEEKSQLFVSSLLVR